MAAEAGYRQLFCRGRGADWTNLPELAIDQILDGLDSPKDYLRFLLVCKAWMYYALPMWPYKKAKYERFLAPHPMLIVGNHVYSAGTREMITTSEDDPGCCFKWPMRPWPYTPSPYPHSRVIGSSFGWLLTHGPRINGIVTVMLINPQSSQTLRRYYRLSPPSDTNLDGFHPSKGVLSADPSSSRNYGLAVLFRKPSTESSRLLFLKDLRSKNGGTYWFYQTSDHVLDIAHHADNICVLQKEIPGAVNTDPEGLVIATLSRAGDTIRKAKITYVWDDIPFERKPLPPRVGRHVSTAHLVERLPGSGDCCSVGYNHWLVMRHRIISELEGVVSTVRFGVFEWVHSKKGSQGSMLWRRVHELKNEAIFLGRNSAFSIPAGPGLLAAGGRLQPNHIYYIDDQQLTTEKENLVTAPPDIGTFDVVQGCHKPFGFPRVFKHLLNYDVMKDQPPPLWFTVKP